MEKLIYLVLLVVVLACNGPGEDKKDTQPTAKVGYVGTGKLIPISATDSNYYSLASYAKDTVTPTGWTVKYFVKDDSTRYHDVYIEWAKGKRKGYYIGRGLQDVKTYFVPVYEGENQSGIFFSHACATDCKGLLALSKDTMNGFNDYIHVIDFNAKLGQILFLPEVNYQDNYDKFELALVDILHKKQHKIAYNAIAKGIYKEAAVEKVVFGGNKIAITTNLCKSVEDTVSRRETRNVLLDK